MLSFFHLFATKLRLGNPWKYKVPLLITFPYLLILFGKVEMDTAWYSFLAALCTSFGFAGLGYLSNDLSDRKVDIAAGKENATTQLNAYSLALIGGLFLALALIPWMYLPLDRISVFLIFTELGLFVMYAFRPFRLKERGFLGVLADALYAHVIPAVLASWTFHLIGGKSFALFLPFIALVFCWQLVSGIRNILDHQLKDFKNDLMSGMKTFVTQHGTVQTRYWLTYMLLPLEGVFFLLFGLFIILKFPWYGAILLVYILIALLRYYRWNAYYQQPAFKRFSTIFLDDFYILWLPLIVLTALIFEEMHVRYILLTHVLIFRNILRETFFPRLKHLGIGVLKSNFVRKLFKFENYSKGLIVHLVVLCAYFGVFIAIYYYIQSQGYSKEEFFWRQGLLSQKLIALILLHALVVVIQRRKQSLELVRTYFLEKSSPFNLAIFRIIIFIIILGSIHVEILGNFMDWTSLPHSAREPLPFLGWLIEILPISPELYKVLGVCAYVLAAFICVGFQTRWSLYLFVPIALYLWGVPNFFGKLNHHHIMVWVPMILALSPCGDAFSVDAWLRRLRGKSTDRSERISYFLPLKLIWLLLAVIYVCSGFHKLWDTGLYWALSDNITNQIQLEWVEHYDTVSSFRIDQWPILLRTCSVGVIIMEIVYPLFIFKASTRVLAFISAWTLHLSSGYFLYIDFVHLRLVHLSIINWERIKSGRIWKKKPLPPSPALGSTAELFRIPLFYLGILMVSINLLFGILQINTWPFSAYPSYSSLVEDRVDLLEMYATDRNGKYIDVKQIGQDVNFRWENIRPFEQRIAEQVHQGKTSNLQRSLEEYWLLWATKVRGLEQVSEVQIILKTTPLEPESRHIVLDSIYLGTVRP